MRNVRQLAPLTLALGVASGASAQTPSPDPVFAHGYESGVLSLTPNLGYVAEGASGVSSAPTPLTVTLSAPAASATFVPIASADPSRLQIVGGGTTVALGQTSAVVTFNALVAGAVPVTVRAGVDNRPAVGVRVEKALNETNLPAEADFCNLQFPLVINDAVAGQPVQDVFGQLFETDVTAAPGAAPGWAAQVGYGLAGTDPRDLANWYFFDASYNVQVGGNDEYVASFTAPAPGTYLYTSRFSSDGGGVWTYCDTDGAGSNGGLSFSTTSLGTMVVNSN